MVVVNDGDAILASHINAKLDKDNSDNKPTAHFQPATTSIYDLGTNDLKWRNVYLSGDLSIGGNSSVEILTVNNRITPDANAGANIGESTKGFQYLYLTDNLGSVYRLEMSEFYWSDNAETGSTPAGQYPTYWADAVGLNFTNAAVYSSDTSYAGTKSFKFSADNDANETDLILKPNGTSFKTNFTVKFMFYWDNTQINRYICVGFADAASTTCFNNASNKFGFKVDAGSTNMVDYKSGTPTGTFTQALGSAGWKAILMKVNSSGQVQIKFEGSTVIDFGSTTLVNSSGVKSFHFVCEGADTGKYWYADNVEYWDGTGDTPTASAITITKM